MGCVARGALRAYPHHLWPCRLREWLLRPHDPYSSRNRHRSLVWLANALAGGYRVVQPGNPWLRSDTKARKMLKARFAHSGFGCQIGYPGVCAGMAQILDRRDNAKDYAHTKIARLRVVHTRRARLVMRLMLPGMVLSVGVVHDTGRPRPSKRQGTAPILTATIQNVGGESVSQPR